MTKSPQMRNQIRVSFDFDGTLENEEVQNVAKDLKQIGYDICILTTRYSNPKKYHFPVSHDHLYQVAKKIGINEINFTEFEWKATIIDKLKIHVHLDNNYHDEVHIINGKCKAKAVHYVPDTDWKTNLHKTIALTEKEETE